MNIRKEKEKLLDDPTFIVELTPDEYGQFCKILKHNSDVRYPNSRLINSWIRARNAMTEEERKKREIGRSNKPDNDGFFSAEA